MTTYEIRSAHLDLPAATVELLRYEDGSLAVRASNSIEAETLSTSLSAQGAKAPGPDEFYCRDYSEFVGVPDALVACGLAVKVRLIEVGPFRSPAWLMRLAGGVK